jgi:transposase
MGKQIRADYSQSFLLPPSVEDWVPLDHPARFIRDFVDSLDLGDLGFAIPEAVERRHPETPDPSPAVGQISPRFDNLRLLVIRNAKR